MGGKGRIMVVSIVIQKEAENIQYRAFVVIIINSTPF